MRCFTKVLAAVDFSLRSRDVVRYAASLCEPPTGGARLDVLHVWRAPDLPVSPEGIPARVLPWQDLSTLARDEAGRQLDRLLADLDLDRDPRVRRRLEPGDPAHVIVKLAAEGYELIVMGTHGRHGLSHLLLGSVAEKVLRSAPCPVLVLREVPPRINPGEL